MSKFSIFSIFIFLGLLFAAHEANACRIIPHPPIVIDHHRPAPLQPIRVQSHNFHAVIKDGVAITTLETVFFNPNHMMLEGTYLFPLPKGASIDKFSMWIDDKEMQAELLDAGKARQIYIDIVRRMVDPGLLEFVGRETFKLRIFPIPPNGPKRIKLSYQQVLPSDGGLIHYVYPLTTVGNGREDTLGKTSWKVDISSQIAIKSVFSPSHNVKVVKEDKKATVTFEADSLQPDKDFNLYISRSDKDVDLTFLPFSKKSEDGYFLAILSPKTEIKNQEINPKDVVFVADTSGSMHGDKIKQLKGALKYCVEALKPSDRFNLVLFSTVATVYKDNLLEANADNIKAALSYIDEEVVARGATNIEEALDFALKMAPKESNRPFMVIFMTDGTPTVGAGIHDADELVQIVKKLSSANLRLFTFGIGEQINSKLLDRLAEENKGMREYVGSKENLEFKVSAFFDKVSFPVLSNIEISFPSTPKLRITEVYPRHFPDLFKGSSITLLGRYKGTGDQAIKVSGMMAGQKRDFAFETNFPEESTENSQIPRLWAVRKIGFLLEQIRLHGESAEVKQEVVQLAMRFGVVTPYTSYLVVEDTPIATAPREDRPVRPAPFAPQGGFRDSNGAPAPSMEREAGEAKKSMKAETGADAIDASRSIRRMKESIVAEEADDKGKSERAREVASQIRKIADKTFYLQNGIWQDSLSYTKEAQKMSKKRVQYQSEEYFDLVVSEPEIGKFLSLGKKVIFVWKNQIYEIY